MFDRLADGYDLFNPLASLGLCNVWRKKLVRLAVEKCEPNRLILDIGTGTGDLIGSIADSGNKAGHSNSHLGMDFSGMMLERAGAKFKFIDNLSWVQADAAKIPIVSGTVGAVVSAFTMRNLKKIAREALAEVYRVLAPGGRIWFLDMHAPQMPVVKQLHRFYLKTVLSGIGYGVFGERWSKDYLADTILAFGPAEEFSEVLRQAGFKDVGAQRLSGGIAVIHSGVKK